MAGDFEMKKDLILANLLEMLRDAEKDIIEIKELDLQNKEKYSYMNTILSQEDWFDVYDMLCNMWNQLFKINRREFLKEIDKEKEWANI